MAAPGLIERIRARLSETAGAMAGHFVRHRAGILAAAPLAYQVAAASPGEVKAMFQPTILATPVLALATTGLTWSSASAAWRSYRLPRWWSLASMATGLIPLAGVIGHADSGFLYPDVQQQLCGNAVLLWVALTSIVVFCWTRRR